MRKQGATALLLASLVGLTVILAGPASVRAAGTFNAYTEVGDAGNTLNDPQVLFGGPYDSILGQMNGPSDTADVYAIHWIGGPFLAQYFSGSDPTISLFDAAQNPLGSNSGLNPVLSLANVPAGNYLFAVSDLIAPTAPNGPNGPVSTLYDVQFSSPNDPNTLLTISAPTAATAVPEPLTAATLTLAAVALGLKLVRRRPPLAA